MLGKFYIRLIVLFVLRRTAANAASSGGTGFSRIVPYHRLLWEAWLPAFRDLVEQWDCKNADRMVYLLDSWNPVLPNWMMEHILEQLILPKIRKEVDHWNPSTDLLLIHVWIHPWLPRLGMEDIYKCVILSSIICFNELHFPRIGVGNRLPQNSGKNGANTCNLDTAGSVRAVIF